MGKETAVTARRKTTTQPIFLAIRVIATAMQQGIIENDLQKGVPVRTCHLLEPNYVKKGGQRSYVEWKCSTTNCLMKQVHGIIENDSRKGK